MIQSLAGDFSTARVDDYKGPHGDTDNSSSATHSHTPCHPEAEMSDMQKSERQKELVERLSCQGRDGQKTVYPVSFLSSTLSLLPARYFLVIACASVKFSQYKVGIL